MVRYLDPKYDLTFKRVFGEHKHLCLSLVNSMLPFEPEEEAVDIEYISSELIPPFLALKHSIVDVRCVDSRGRQFLVEMQMNWDALYKQRVLFNASKAYVMQLHKSEDVKLLHPVYSINFINKIFERTSEMNDEYYHHYKIVNILHTEKQIKGLEFVFVELPKYNPKNRAEKKLRDLWLRFLTEINEGTKETPSELLACPETREALHYMEVGAYSIEQMDAYDRYRVAEMVAAGIIDRDLKESREKGHREGKEEGRREGKEEGKEEGIREGKEEGHREGKEEGIREGKEEGIREGKEESRLEIARNLLAVGLPADTVIQTTGLTPKQIEELNKVES
ncbi:MAG: Rpn family recombination-promoting nuclease/putative transposase [Tannerella sp.]|jgi:predicted transposase/invertase (TIGR01784 family)|nr:Rpn family recombination-promoting nuclease/putative transposase [Tannerella sp.]